MDCAIVAKSEDEDGQFAVGTEGGGVAGTVVVAVAGAIVGSAVAIAKDRPALATLVALALVGSSWREEELDREGWRWQSA